MASKKGIHFTLTIPRKRERNVLTILQAKAEALRGVRVNSKKYKGPRNKNEWLEEDWGEDDDQNI